MKKKLFGDSCWEVNYKNGRFNKYPYDDVVSFIKRNYKEQSTILDLGCGGGNNSLFFLNEGHNVVAIDGSKTSLKLTKDLCHNNKHLLCLHNDLCNLDIENDVIDCVVDRQSMGHNSRESIEEIIEELYRVLKKGGKIQSFLFSHNHPNLKNCEYTGTNNYYKFTNGIFSKSGFVYFTNSKDLEQLFHKFKIIDIRTVSTYSYVKKCSIDEYFVVEVQK